MDVTVIQQRGHRMKTSLKAVFGLAMACALGANSAWAQDVAVAEAIKKGGALPDDQRFADRHEHRHHPAARGRPR